MSGRAGAGLCRSRAIGVGGWCAILAADYARWAGDVVPATLSGKTAVQLATFDRVGGCLVRVGG
ncbi:MAG TPA: hypothetical protein VL985_00490 [Stellaceae bacterium]|nr:hypothetical protein [Stellaceae bacterium]